MKYAPVRGLQPEVRVVATKIAARIASLAKDRMTIPFLGILDHSRPIIHGRPTTTIQRTAVTIRVTTNPHIKYGSTHRRSGHRPRMLASKLHGMNTNIPSASNVPAGFARNEAT